MVSIAPSMLSADFLNLGKDVGFVNEHADMFHLDIMDGVFVPNISYGFPVVDAIAKRAGKPMDAHLMIVNPEKYVKRFAESGVSMISFHLDAADNPMKVLDEIKSCGVKAGIAINPDIPVSSLFPYLGHMDFALIMSVFAGFGGQKFIESSYGRVSELKAAITNGAHDCLIEVDGGISPANSAGLAAAGADILVAGSSVFRSDDPASVIASMKH